MTRLTYRSGRRYCVGIGSVFGRCLLGLLAFLSAAMISAPAWASNAEVPPFYNLIDACVEFQQSGEADVFEGLVAVAPLEKICAECSQTFGEYRANGSDAIMKVSFLGNADTLRVSCTTSSDQPPMSGETESAIGLWIERHTVKHALTTVKDEPWSLDACAASIVPYRMTVLYDVSNPGREALFFFHGRPRFDICGGATDA